MPELAFIDQHKRRRYRSRQFSPDSVIYSVESSFSLFSSSASASASVESCSSISDVFNHDSIVPCMSQYSSSARSLDADPNKSSTVRKNGGPYILGKKVKKTQDTDGENQTVFSARSSFSNTIKECQYRKSRSEILLRKSDWRRPASLDLNNKLINVTSYSPRLGAAMKSSGSARINGMFPSPGTPNYRPTSIGVHKGWSSERVAALHTNGNRIALMPYNNNNGRTLPSKWEDAERWIISPVAGDGALKPAVEQPQRRPKAKSGPLGPPGSACYSMYSPAVPSFEGVNVRSFVSESPLSTGVNADNSLLIQYHDARESNGNFPSLMDHCIARSVSIHGCSEMVNHSLLQITQDDKTDGLMDAATNISGDVSRRDMATQMTPESSPYSSPRRKNSTSLSSSIQAVNLQQVRSSKADVRDVQVDDQVTLTQHSIKNRARIPGRRSDIDHDWKNKGSEVGSADWEVSEMKKSLSKVKREEAKITAWENLQKAKAEASIRKLEMKLEKKRSSSMDRIMHKLRSAQKKAQEMKESVISNQSRPVATSSPKAISLIKTRQIRSLSGCFTCPAF